MKISKLQKGENSVSKNKKNRDKKNKEQPAFYNDQLGENASEVFDESYDNKKPRNRNK